MTIFKKRNLSLKILLFLLIFSIFLSTSLFRLDPDFGWHLKTGQLILQNRQIPHIDWYSYTMPNFPWIAHEWLTDILIYLIYSIFGYFALSFIFALISTLSVFIVVSARKIKYSFIPAILGTLALLPFVGVRPQMITILFLAIIYVLIKKFLWSQQNKKIFFLLPLIFILWANLHGGFFIGLFLLFLFFVIKLFHYFKNNLKNNLFPFDILLILLGCILATFINPYGPYIYREVFSTIIDPFLKFHINEWLPLFYNLNLFLIIYLGTFIGLLICLYKDFSFFDDLFIPIIFLLLGISSTRNFALFVIISIPLITDFLLITSRKANKRKKNYFKENLKSPVVIFFLSVGFLCIFMSNINQGLITNNTYPYKAITYLKSHPIKGNMFNVYDWGGFLIWNLPENKVFIDGRMPSWQYNNKYVFKDYVDMTKDKNSCQDLLKKYDVKYALVKKKETENNIIDKWLYNSFNHQASNKSFKEMFIDLGYTIVYQDEIAIIFKSH